MSTPDDVTDAWIDGLAEGVILVEDGRVQRLNRAAAGMLDVEVQRAIGRPLIAVLRDHRLERAYLEGTTLELETRGRILLAVPLEGGLGLRDVTELRRSEEDIRELLAVLSHELRTPVTAIRAALEALRFDLHAEQRSRFLAHAESEAERLVRLVEDLTVEVRPPRARQLALEAILDRAATLLRATFRGEGVVLDSRVGRELIWADGDKVLQVLLNLLENAAVHGPSGGRVVVSCCEDAEQPGFLRVVVGDQGEVPAGEEIEAWFRLHSRGKRSAGAGNGLGLSIVRSIVAGWGGRCWGRTLPEGKEFCFTVPASAARGSSAGGPRRDGAPAG